ncbi:MAG: PilZ domain-containing protein [Bdellovibrio bacteriovorus]
MLADRHHGARHPLGLPVQVLYGRRRVCGARVRSLSIQGMALTLRNLTLPPGTLVELELGGLGRAWLVEAVVVHSAGSEAGLLFRKPQPELYQGLLQAGWAGADEAAMGVVNQPGARVERPQLARH